MANFVNVSAFPKSRCKIARRANARETSASFRRTAFISLSSDSSDASSGAVDNYSAARRAEAGYLIRGELAFKRLVGRSPTRKYANTSLIDLTPFVLLIDVAYSKLTVCGHLARCEKSVFPKRWLKLLCFIYLHLNLSGRKAFVRLLELALRSVDRGFSAEIEDVHAELTLPALAE
jgi:hypothetical protein